MLENKKDVHLDIRLRKDVKDILDLIAKREKKTKTKIIEELIFEKYATINGRKTC